MPLGDRTGPQGLGPRTGRGGGFCAGFGGPGSVNPGFGRGHGGRGWRNWFHTTGLTGWQRAFRGEPQTFATPPRDQGLGALKAQARRLESALGEIRRRIEALEERPSAQEETSGS